MRNIQNRFTWLAFLALLALVVGPGSLACEDDKTPVIKKYDAAPKEAGTADLGPDKGTTPDKPKTPDKSSPDLWPHQDKGKDIFPKIDTGKKLDQGYKPSPFGCVSDGDCFGQKCCPTPWGVKLCAPACEL